MTQADALRDQPRYGRVAVPAAWAFAVTAVVTTVLVLVDKGNRAWGEHGPVLLEGEGDPGPYIFLSSLTALFLTIATRLSRREPTNSLARWTAVFAFGASGAVITDMASSWLLSFRAVTDLALVLRLFGSLWLGVAWSAMLFILLRFPTGRRLARGWVVVEVLALSGAGLLALAMFAPDNADVEPFTSPLADTPLAGIADLGFHGWTLLSGGVLLALISILIRAVRARGDERQQLKWVGYGLLFGWGGAFVITILTGPGDEDGGARGILADSDLAVTVGELLMPFFIFAMPAALLVAMFRYRLWDIDRIIRRTAAYVVVVMLLGGVYAAMVLALGVGVFGVSQDGDVAGAGPIPVALATLAAAGLFRPLQRRVKDVVDRRFNRRRAESLQRLEEFGSSLRDVVDVQSLASGVEAVAAEALEPATVALWLAGDASRPVVLAEVSP